MRGKENMGRQGKWFVAVKKLFAAESDDKKNLKIEKAQETPEFDGSKDANLIPPETAEIIVCDAVAPTTQEVEVPEDGAVSQLLLPPTTQEVKVLEDGAVSQLLLPPTTQEVKVSEEEGQSKHACSVVPASAVAAEAAAITAPAVAAVIHLTGNSIVQVPSKSIEETAAIKIQSAFRGYTSRRSWRDSRGLSRLKEIVDGDAVKRQTANTMHVMQALSKVQSQMRSRKIRMSEENQSLRRQLQLKEERELEKLKAGGEWNHSPHSKEKMQAKQLNKQEAAMRRERALAYAFSHQWKSSARTLTPAFSDANSPQWDWSWVERWTAARPWESRVAGETSDQASTRSWNHSTVQETVKTNGHRDNNLECTPATQRNRPASRHLPSMPPSKLSAAGNKKSASPRGICGVKDDDSRSLALDRLRMRRHSIGGFSDVSLTNSSAITSSVPSTASAVKAKFQLHSPLSASAANPEKGPVSLIKNRLSFPATAHKRTVSSPTNVRRHSVLPKVGIASLMDATANGGSR